MADYSKATNFSVKDTLSTGDPNKIVSGAEIDTEFDNIAVASGTKADKVSGATSGNVAQLDTNGNLVDSGLSSTDVSNVSGVITTEGDLMVGNGSGDEARLAIGSSGRVLQSNGTTASWQSLTYSDVSFSNNINQGDIASSAVGRGELKTSTGSTAGFISAGSRVDITLNAYSFFPMIHASGAPLGDDPLIIAHPTDGASADAPRFSIRNQNGSISTNYDVDHRYVAG